MKWKNWFPAFLWMGCIFVFSTDLFSASHTESFVEHFIHFFFPLASDETVQFAHFVIRKCAHVTVYFILGIFYTRGLTNKGERHWNLKMGGIALALVFLYACTDEWHQSFSTLRTASFADVLYDTFGGFISQILNAYIP